MVQIGENTDENCIAAGALGWVSGIIMCGVPQFERHGKLSF
jgi:hypothetical protein